MPTRLAALHRSLMAVADMRLLRNKNFLSPHFWQPDHLGRAPDSRVRFHAAPEVSIFCKPLC